MPGAPYPESPCIGLCQMNGDRSHCVGCGRTLNEIATWSRMSVDDKRAVLRRIGEEGQRPGDEHKAQ